MALSSKKHHFNVREVASYLVDVNNDILNDGFCDVDYDDATEAEYSALFRYVYLHGSCAVFALAVHDRFKLPIVRFLSNDFSVHFACRLAHDRFLDASGIVSSDDIRKRYRFSAQVEPRSVCVEECRDDALVSEDDHELQYADFVIDYLNVKPAIDLAKKERR